MDNALVRYSRAGDAFHYRWAARRCLRLLDVQSGLTCITIEGSKESDAAGEYSIDLAEYSEVGGINSIAYFQLKHTTKRKNSTFTQSELKPSLNAFGKRYSALFLRRNVKRPNGPVTFSFVTNRPLNQLLKDAVSANASGKKASRRIQEFLEKATGLRGHHLQAFCSSLYLLDGEGDYIVQKRRLRNQLSEIIAGFVDSREIDAIIALVTDRALPISDDGRVNNTIYREDVLQRFGVSSERDLFPAPAEFENLSTIIEREQHADLFKLINGASGPTIVHAAGGVGKSVVARQLLNSVPKGSQGLIYDCFGGGKYRNPSEPRHRVSDALVQLANELAARGLSAPLIAHAGVPADAIFRSFLDRLSQAIGCLREAEPAAFLILLIDAADNAELVAADNGDKCFASQLLHVTLPPGCRLVMFCRSERLSLLKPSPSYKRYELKPFSKSESAEHFRKAHSEGSDRDCLEFHRLTGGNPRVQANALAYGHSVDEVLTQLGPNQTTVADQISSQLHAAVTAIKDRQANDSQIDAICLGLANLPPFVPLIVLAEAASVNVSEIRSFVSDLGRPLWHTDDSVQFRDEPTETWFRETFSANKGQIGDLILRLEPLAKKYTYVAKVLPQLLLRRGDYKRLVKLALSDDLLPQNNAFDEREIRLYRLQFAFRAALRLSKQADAVRLAFRAGEEAAGSERHASMMQANLHLIAPLHGSDRIQEIAYRHLFTSTWEGSENLFSASLLSTVPDFRGEARSYLRASEKWLRMFFDNRRREQENSTKSKLRGAFQLQDSDLAEMSFAYLNLHGPSSTVQWLKSWTPPEVTFRLTRILIRRLVDLGRFEDIDALASAGDGVLYIMLAIVDELLAVGKHLPRKRLILSLSKMSNKGSRIEKPNPHTHEDPITPAILSLLESATFARLSKKLISAVLRFFAPAIADRSVISDFQNERRRTFLRAVALKAVNEGNETLDSNSLLPPENAKALKNGAPPFDRRERQDLAERVGVLLPWYLLRASVLAAQRGIGSDEIRRVQDLSAAALRARYRTYDPLSSEIPRVRFEILALAGTCSNEDVSTFIDFLKTEKRFPLHDRLTAARAAYRLPDLSHLREPLENSCRETIDAPGEEAPEERARWFTLLATAVFPESAADAAAYFNEALEAMSKYGDEMVERWQAVSAVARRCSEGHRSSPEMAYRFIRCGEMVGQTVAREKYWDRDDVFRIAVRLDGPSAFAGLSRWQDRQVGYFDEQIVALGREAVEAKILSPRVARSLSGFKGCNRSSEFAASCVKGETKRATQQKMLEDAVHDLELAGTSLDAFKKLEDVAEAANLSKTNLWLAIKAHDSAATAGGNDKIALKTFDRVPESSEKRSFEECFIGVDLTSANGLRTSLSNLKKTKPPWEFRVFWRTVVREITRGKELIFMHSILSANELSVYDVREAVSHIRSEWLTRASVKKEWPIFLKQVGSRFAVQLSSRGSLSHFRNESQLAQAELSVVIDGIVEGLSEAAGLIDAGTFFGFITMIAPRLKVREASDLLDYSLARFEKHFDDDFSDGPWAEWLKPPESTSEAVVGLIWSSLGSPYSSTRWQAAHCVRRLARYSCDREIALLIKWMETDRVLPFGSHRLPFYGLHAKLYLLIALARLAIDDTAVLIPHSDVFSRIALNGIPHVLIQKTAATIAIAIEVSKSHSYSPSVVRKLEMVGMTPLPARNTSNHGYQGDTPWHIRGELDLTLDVYLGYDFDRYWLSPLGSVFGVTEKAMNELARNFAVQTFHIPHKEPYSPDPRQDQWNRLERFDGGYTTHYDHGSYPSVDNFAFYYSYHSIFGVAAGLIREMPVVRDARYDYQGDRWAAWLSRHLLTRSDGKWLADRRDATPPREPSWVGDGEAWKNGIQIGDFLEVLQNGSVDGFLCVSGRWRECDGSREEDVYVETALVNPIQAEAIANALRKSEETYCSVLPSIGDDESESSGGTPGLEAWICHGNHDDKRLDAFDPYSRGIQYPPRAVGDAYLSLLKIVPDGEHRKWCTSGSSEPLLTCDTWSDKHVDLSNDRPFRSGERICASLQLLVFLCKKTGKDIIFEVRIRRNLDDRHTSLSSSKIKRSDPSRKIFVFSSDGTVRERRRKIALL